MATGTFDINEMKRRMQGAVQSLKHELGGLRTGRASASMLDPVQVEAYGSQHAAQPGGHRQRAGAAADLGAGLGQVDGQAGREGDRRFQSRPVARDRRPGAAPAHSRAQRGAPQGAGQGRAQIRRSRQGRRAPCPPRRPRCAQEAREESRGCRRTTRSVTPTRCRRRPTARSPRSISCWPPRKKKSSPSRGVPQAPCPKAMPRRATRRTRRPVRRARACRHHHGWQRALGGRARSAACRRPSPRRRSPAPRGARVARARHSLSHHLFLQLGKLVAAGERDRRSDGPSAALHPQRSGRDCIATASRCVSSASATGWRATSARC